MREKLRAVLGSIVAANLAWADLAKAGECDVVEEQRFMATNDEIAGRLGASLAISQIRGLAGAPDNSELGSQAGAVIAISPTDDGSSWTITQTLVASDAASGDQFGRAVDVDGLSAIVGAPFADPSGILSAGAAYVLAFDTQQWTELEKLTSTTPAVSGQFGLAVAIEGPVIACGAPGEMEKGVATGAVHVFRFDGTVWHHEARLEAPDGQLGDSFGAAVALSGNVILVGAPQDDDLATNSGSAYVFRFDGISWQFEQKLLATNGNNTDGFGAAVALDGSTAVIGAPKHDTPVSNAGGALVFTESSKSWSFLQRLVPSFLSFDDGYGSAVAIEGDAIVVGSPRDDVLYPGKGALTTDAGTISVFRLGSTWIDDYRARARWVVSGGNTAINMGAAVAIDNGVVLAGAPDDFVSGVGGDAGSTFRFSLEPADCDGDGIADVCQADCNLNGLIDQCELADGLAPDCDNDQSPDECSATAAYAFDDGTGDQAWGFLGTGGDLICLNTMAVTPGAQRITHLACPWSVPPGLEAHLVLYDDPDNDGNPVDATLLSMTTISTPPVESFLTGFSIHAIEPTIVGEPGDTFFAGIVVSLPPNTLGILSDSAPSSSTGWRSDAPYQRADPVNLAANGELDAFDGWMIRALAMDCNANGTWDQCDIETGRSNDANGNEIPDECETSRCIADLTGDGDVGPADLANLLAAWGTDPGGPPDFDSSRSVGPEDLAVLLADWGEC